MCVLVGKRLLSTTLPVALALCGCATALFGAPAPRRPVYRKQPVLLVTHKRGYSPALFPTFAPDGKTLAFSSGGVELWNLAPWKKIASFSSHQRRHGPSSAGKIRFSNDGKHLGVVWGGSARKGPVWLFFERVDISTRKLLKSTDIHDSYRVVDISSDLSKLLCEWRVFDLSSGRVLTAWRPPCPECACFSPDGRRIAIGSPEGLRIVDAANGKALLRFPDARGVGTLFFSQDGSLLAGGSGITTRIWETKTGKLARTVGVGCVVGFSPDGSVVATGSRSDVELWETATGAKLHVLKGGKEGLNGFAWSRDGTTVALTYWCGTLKVWRFKSR